MTTAKAYRKGSACPPLESGKLRVYSMRFCPYAERTRLILAHLNVPHEIINVNLTQKPEWYLEKNSLGFVPTLEVDNKIIYESPICCEFIDETYGDNQLLSKDPYTKAKQKMLCEWFSKVPSGFFSGMKNESLDDIKKGICEVNKVLKVFEDELSGKYFGGDHPNFVDFYIWPWFERLPLVHKICGQEYMKHGVYPKLDRWIKTMLELPAVKACPLPLDAVVEFARQKFDPSVDCPDYDIGL